MTRKRVDEHSTEFGLWLREQKDIDSSIGYIASNIDFMWRNYKTREWMLIEEKRFNSRVRFPQTEMFKILDEACKNDPNYRGFHILVFENTSPLDGKIILNGKIITNQELIQFLKFDVKWWDQHEC